jgi:hypothetical protein
METQYGDDGAPDPRDLVTYLEWCRDEHRASTTPGFGASGSGTHR